jgi:3-methyladenine DNA glycosylase Tag
MNVSFDFDSPNDFTTYITETAGPLQKMLANQTIERKREMLKAVTEAAQKYVDNNTGKVSFENELYLLLVKNE